MATRDDLRDLVDVLAAQLTEHFERVDARLDQSERGIEGRLGRIERLLSPEAKP